MKKIVFSTLLVLLFNSSIAFAQNSDDRQLWLITAKISHNSTYQRDTASSFMAGPKKWAKEYHQSAKETASGTITAIVENQAENPGKDFQYHSDSGEPVSITVNGNGSNSESSNSQETIDGTLISADIRTDNVAGSVRPGASLYFEYSDETKSFGITLDIKAVGSYNGRTFDGEWKDYGGDYDDYNINCSGGGDVLTDKNCKMIKTGKGYQGSWKESESEIHHTSNGPEYTTNVTTVEITVMPYKESDKPTVTIDGCTDPGVGQTATVKATAKPGGGSYKFWVEPSDLMTVSTSDAIATLTGKTPGRGMLMVEYTTKDGKTAQASVEASCVKIESYNGGQAIPQIAFYDIDGKKQSGIKTVSVQAQPTDAAELVKYEVADPGVLSAVGVGGEVTLQALREGKTNLQAKTKCGEPTGPKVEVEVVKCDDETIATLERMRKVAMENLVDVTNRLQKVAGSEEFQKARNELVSSTRELLAKAALTIIANGKSPTTAIKVAAEIADKGAALSEVIASSTPEEMKDNIGKTASGDSFEKIMEKQFGEKVSDVYGKSLSAAIAVAEVQQAAKKFGENMGEILKNEAVVEGLAKDYEKAMRDLERITQRQQLCKGGTEKPQSKEQPQSDQTPKPSDPTPKKPTSNPEPTTGKQPEPTEPTPTATKSDDEVIGDPEPPVIPPKQVGLPYEASDCGCGKSKELTAKSADFSSLGVGMKNLGNCVENFRSTSLTDYQLSLQEISALTDSLSTTLKSNAGSFLVKAKASKPRLDELVSRVKTYDKAGTEFLKKMDKCPDSVTTGMEILQSAEKITIDSIKTHY
jgi:hypothetical protein